MTPTNKDRGTQRANSGEMLATLEGLRGALRMALPFLPADKEAIHAGEWIDEANEVIAKMESAATSDALQLINDYSIYLCRDGYRGRDGWIAYTPDSGGHYQEDRTRIIGRGETAPDAFNQALVSLNLKGTR